MVATLEEVTNPGYRTRLTNYSGGKTIGGYGELLRRPSRRQRAPGTELGLRTTPAGKLAGLRPSPTRRVAPWREGTGKATWKCGTGNGEPGTGNAGCRGGGSGERAKPRLGGADNVGMGESSGDKPSHQGTMQRGGNIA